MQSVSEAWKQAQARDIVPETFIEISYRVDDPAAQTDTTATDNGHIDLANTAQTTDDLDKTYMPYASLELNSWILDGTRNVLPDTVTQDMGFISSVLSKEDCTFDANPVITINFSRLHTNLIPGVTIRWSDAFNECANSFVVTAYNGASAVATKTVTGNTQNLSTVEVDISSYDKIEIEVVEWCLPFHRVRVEEVIIGTMTVFEKSHLLGYEHSQSVDLLSAELPKAQIVFSLHNVESEWNPNNPQGVWRYLLKKQEIAVRYGLKIGNSIEWIKAGTFYMSDWNTPTNGITAKFTARDLLEFMQGEFTKSTTTLTLYDLAEQAFTQSNLPLNKDGSNKWNIDSSLSSITVTLPDDFKHTRAEVVQLCASAACCVFYQDRNGVLHIKPLADVLADYVISKFTSYSHAEYQIGKELKSVDVNDGLGAATNSTEGEVQKLDNQLIQGSTRASAVAEWVKDCLAGRKTLSGEYRADPRMDALDKVTIENKYATNTAFITSIKYTFNGAFRGKYEGRVVI